jgi:protein-glutamine gamma-glutamyltransferase
MSAVSATPWVERRSRDLAPEAVRVVTATALALFGALYWAGLEAPAARGWLILCVVIAAGTAVAWLAARRSGLAVRIAVSVLAAVLTVPASGVALRLLAPAGWGDLVSGIGQGIDSMPGIGVPYQGVDPWVRIDIRLGGGLLIVIGVLLAAHALRRDARPVAGATVLTLVYAIPVVEHAPRHPYAGGAAFAVLLGALLWADRIERRYAGAAAAFAAAALLGGLALAPRLDGSRAWLDYEQIANVLTSSKTTAFDWTHRYGALTWPRDGRELLRVSAPTPVYWKATDLDEFDGVRWRTDRLLPHGRDTQLAAGHPTWHERVRVTLRALRSSQYVGAGTALDIRHSPRVIADGPPGTFLTGAQPLRRGDSYVIDVYAPRPSVPAMTAAGTAYPTFTGSYLGLELPPSVGGPAPGANAPSTLGPIQVQFQPFGIDAPPVALAPGVGPSGTPATRLLRRSAYASMYALAQDLRSKAATPFDYVRLVENHFAQGYAYTETPPAPRPGRPPLVSFVFDSHAGYCQQFSGAMALLLRMGGVPARVASGFTPGTYDRGRREWVVRDFEAHSWVAAYFPGIGWVTFDPTPAVAPPRGQLAAFSNTRGADVRPVSQGGRRADVPRRGAQGAGGGGSDISIGGLLAAVFGVVVLGAAGMALVTRARRRRDPAITPELAELDRALRRTRRPPLPGQTLRGLEQRWRLHAPGAAAYVEAVRLARFAGHDAGPTREQRAALRRELGEGLGMLGRLRAWWALPPARHGLRRPYTET